MPVGERDLANESFFEYGSRVGVWRIMNILDEFKVKATFYCCALALGAQPGRGQGDNGARTRGLRPRQ